MTRFPPPIPDCASARIADRLTGVSTWRSLTRTERLHRDRAIARMNATAEPAVEYGDWGAPDLRLVAA